MFIIYQKKGDNIMIFTICYFEHRINKYKNQINIKYVKDYYNSTSILTHCKLLATNF